MGESAVVSMTSGLPTVALEPLLVLELLHAAIPMQRTAAAARLPANFRFIA
ncbi:MAG TPA: hypothetical protein VLX31_10490 [Streptosporangiaceae bacterium]|nr:hypothetical protein [Streptosporangiaceae bacterium]